MRPHYLIVVTGTDTEVGKTWVTAALARALLETGRKVALRKPAQSFAPESNLTDADRLAAASGETPREVCPQHRWYPVPMAPPLAAEALGLPPPRIRDLAEEIRVGWPVHKVELGIVEGAGGVAAPQAIDGDTTDLCRAIGADAAVIVAEPGFGAINSVRLAAKALAPLRTIVYLNRYDDRDDPHNRNLVWLLEQDSLTVTTSIEDLAKHFDTLKL